MPIFDQGYQHWSGQLSGHAWRWLAITRHGVRIGMQSRILRLALLFAWLPALVLAFMLCVWGMVERKNELVTPVLDLLVEIGLLDRRLAADPQHYRVVVWTISYDRFLWAELYVSMVLVVLVGPNLISQDLRFNALPLYFSRPLRRIDYFVGKLGIITTFLGMVIIVPSLIAYALGLLFSMDITILRDTLPLLGSATAYGLLIAVSAGLFMLALSSLTRNSRYVALFWLVIWLVSGITGTILDTVAQEQRRHQFYYKNMVAAQPVRSPNQPPPTPEERSREQRAAQDAHQKAWADFEAEEFRAAKTNWRPLVSYTANLSRMGQQLLGTDASWQTLSELKSPNERERFMLEHGGAQYPWYWSAGVLLFLFGLSACILNFRVKSLDRLK
jgi:ABC-2 type transport system permease protein